MEIFAIPLTLKWHKETIVIFNSPLGPYEKADNRIPRDELWYCRKSGVADKYVKVVQDMYESWK